MVFEGGGSEHVLADFRSVRPAKERVSNHLGNAAAAGKDHAAKERLQTNLGPVKQLRLVDFQQANVPHCNAPHVQTQKESSDPDSSRASSRAQNPSI